MTVGKAEKHESSDRAIGAHATPLAVGINRQTRSTDLKGIDERGLPPPAIKTATSGFGGQASPVDPKKLSGAHWRKIADDNGWANSTDINDLSPEFRPKVEAFKGALEEAGANVRIGTTKRHRIRAWLMHWAWDIASGTPPPTDDPHDTGIVWDHGSDGKTRKAAQEMKKAFRMAYRAALESAHIAGNAIDWTITWKDWLLIFNGKGDMVLIQTKPRHGGLEDDKIHPRGNPELHNVGATYGVIKLKKDPPHWSLSGN